MARELPTSGGSSCPTPGISSTTARPNRTERSRSLASGTRAGAHRQGCEAERAPTEPRIAGRRLRAGRVRARTPGPTFDAVRILRGRFAGAVQHKLSATGMARTVEQIRKRGFSATRAAVRVPRDQSTRAAAEGPGRIRVSASSVMRGAVRDTVEPTARQIEPLGLANAESFRRAVGRTAGLALPPTDALSHAPLPAPPQSPRAPAFSTRPATSTFGRRTPRACRQLAATSPSTHRARGPHHLRVAGAAPSAHAHDERGRTAQLRAKPPHAGCESMSTSRILVREFAS